MHASVRCTEKHEKGHYLDSGRKNKNREGKMQEIGGMIVSCKLQLWYMGMHGATIITREVLARSRRTLRMHSPIKSSIKIRPLHLIPNSLLCFSVDRTHIINKKIWPGRQFQINEPCNDNICAEFTRQAQPRRYLQDHRRMERSQIQQLSRQWPQRRFPKPFHFLNLHNE